MSTPGTRAVRSAGSERSAGVVVSNAAARVSFGPRLNNAASLRDGVGLDDEDGGKARVEDGRESCLSCGDGESYRSRRTTQLQTSLISPSISLLWTHFIRPAQRNIHRRSRVPYFLLIQYPAQSVKKTTHVTFSPSPLRRPRQCTARPWYCVPFASSLPITLNRFL